MKKFNKNNKTFFLHMDNSGSGDISKIFENEMTLEEMPYSLMHRNQYYELINNPLIYDKVKVVSVH